MVGVANELSDPSLQVVLDGKCVPTLKVDGSCCAFFNGKFYKRYDAKKGKTPPAGAIPCCDPDPISGHWPHWVEVDEQAPDNKWFVAAKQTYEREGNKMEDGTYEAIGIHFQNNPYHLEKDTLHRHGTLLTRAFGTIWRKTTSRASCSGMKESHCARLREAAMASCGIRTSGKFWLQAKAHWPVAFLYSRTLVYTLSVEYCCSLYERMI